MGRVNIRSNQNHNFKTSHRVSFVVRNNSNKTVKRIRQDNKLAKLGRCDIWKHFWQDGIMVIWLGCSRTHQVTAWRLVWRNSKNLSGQNLEGTLAISVLINFALFNFTQAFLSYIWPGWEKAEWKSTLQNLSQRKWPEELGQNQKTFWIPTDQPPDWCLVGSSIFFWNEPFAFKILHNTASSVAKMRTKTCLW